MKKKIVFIFIIIVALVLTIISATFILKKMEKKFYEVTTFSKVTDVNLPISEWYCNYIWHEESENNEWICFRKTFEIENQKDIKDIIAQITVDSKYWLYVNGKMVVREGALKRARTTGSIYYDNVDLTNYLKEGKNTIAILAWRWGHTSFSHNSTSHLGLLFQTTIGDNKIVSDETWKVQKNEAYLQDDVLPNDRLSEYNIFYDANLEIADWYCVEYDDSNWKNAIIADGFFEPEKILRDIPQFKDYGLKNYENTSDYINYLTEKDEILEMQIPYNAQFMPYLEVEAPKEKTIRIYTDTYKTDNSQSLRCSYVTKEGSQKFESLGWLNGEKVYYEIPAGVNIIKLGYRETGYDTEFTGMFLSDDDFFNKLWNQAQRTLYVNMRDNYMDCPNRERAQWSLDMAIEMKQAMYAFDTNSYDLYKKGIRTIIGWREGDSWLTVAPNTLSPIQLPVQSLLVISSIYDYYLYTGDIEFLTEVYPYAQKYLNLWIENQYGLMDCISYEYIWEWGDSSGITDYKPIENACYYYAKSNMCKIAEILEYTEDVKIYNNQLEKLKKTYNTLWTEEGYKSPASTFADERANAIAVISGLADESKYSVIKKNLLESYTASPCMESYVLEALCIIGDMNSVQERIKNRYNDMVLGENACSTLWESWVYGKGSTNHAWSGSPLTIMSKYFAGIMPLKAGYKEVLIKPNFGTLNALNCLVETCNGTVYMKAKREAIQNNIQNDIQDNTQESKIEIAENIMKNNAQYNMQKNMQDNTQDKVQIFIELDTPVITQVAIPKVSENCIITINDKIVYKDGKEKVNFNYKYIKEDSSYIYFEISGGNYNINCKEK